MTTLLASMASAAPPPVSTARQAFAAMRAQRSVDGTVYFTGNVVDGNNAPIPGARVTLNGVSRLTDSDGYYSVALGASSTGRYVLDIRKEGRAPLSVNYTDSSIDAVHVMRPATTAVINASTGGRVTLQNGTSYVDIPANALVDANGNPATGNVSVTLAHYGPSTMPGDMTAVNAAGEEIYLVSVGALYVGAESNGVSYDLAPGASVSAFISVPSEYGDTMPSCSQERTCTVLAWQLGSDGRWYERGTVTTTETGTYLSMRAPTNNASLAIPPIRRGLGFWNADIAFNNPSCTVIQFVGLGDSCFGELGSTGYPGLTLSLNLPTPFGDTYTKTERITDPNATFIVLYNQMASRLGSAPIYQDVTLTFPSDASAAQCAQRLVIDSSPRAPAGFPTYERPASGGGGGGSTRFEPGLPWGGTGQPTVSSTRGVLQHPCRSKVVFKVQ